MGSKEARTSGYISDRYIEGSKMLTEGVSNYVPYVGDVLGVLETLKEGLANGMIYAGAKSINDMKKVALGIVSVVGQRETAPHDLIGKF
jgi:IMP dehydrogenase